jgi:hypothetical protein
MEVEDGAVNSENADLEKVKLDDVIGHRSAKDKGKISMDREGFRRSAEMEVEGLDYKTSRDKRRLVRLGNPERSRRSTSGQRPNDRAAVIFQKTILKLRTWVPRVVDAERPLHGRILAGRPPVSQLLDGRKLGPLASVRSRLAALPDPHLGFT